MKTEVVIMPSSSPELDLRSPANLQGYKVRQYEEVSPEAEIAGIWAEVLGVDSVGLDDNFFELGGDSLHTVTILSRIHSRFGLTLPPGAIFSSPTVRVLCTLLHAQSPSDSEPPPEPAAKSQPCSLSPATSALHRMWFLDRFIPRPEAYNVYRLVRLEGNLNHDLFRQALQFVVDRHETLRMRFEERDGRPMQAVESHVAVDLPLLSFEHLPAEERMTEVERQATELARRPVDLDKAPLWRFRIWQLSESEFAFLFLFHHAIGDGWSIGRFYDDLAHAYGSLLAEKEVKLVPLPIPYSEYARREQDRLNSAKYREKLSWWKEFLSPLPPTLELPFSKPRPRVQSFTGSVLRFDLPDKLTRQLDLLARRESSTRFQIGLAAFLGVLQRYTGQDDLAIGTPLAGRLSPDVEPLVGMFVNTLVLRTNLQGDPSFRDALRRVKDSTLSAFARQEVTLESIIEALNPPRDTSRQPLFQITFMYLNVRMEPHRLYTHKLSPVFLHNDTSLFDLRVVLEDRPGGLWGWIEYNSDLFERDAMQRLSGHFLTLLEAGCANPDRPLAELPLLAPAEFQQVVHDWNATDAPYPVECIQNAFERQAAMQPGAVAVIAGGREYTYGELDERANRLAHYLRSQGIGTGVYVGICLRRGVGMIEAALAVLKAGGAYVPLDSSYPRDRLAFMLEDTRAAVVLTQRELLDRLPDQQATVYSSRSARGSLVEFSGSPQEYAENPLAEREEYTVARLLCLPDLEAELANFPCTTPAPTSGPRDISYVIYTSGSTGQPKGVVLAHHAVLNTIEWVNSTFAVGPQDRILFVTSLSFDLSVYDIFGVLGAGGSIRIASEDELRDPIELAAVLRSEPITLCDSAPAALVQLVPFLSQRRPGDYRDRLRLALLSGDWIPVPLPDQVRQAFPNVRMIGLGGATEAAIWSNCYPIERVDPNWPSIPYGKPIRNARYRILDQRLQPLPVGVPGELHIGGVPLAEGYLNRTELTAERFIPDPFLCGTDIHGLTPRLYKTGDLARFFPDGTIEFLGRIDHQVKVRGFRVELGEIETVLAQHPTVGASVVKPFKDSSQQNFLVAYVVARNGVKPTATVLGKHLGDKLPDYMVPTHFISLDAIPLTPNGKVDRKALNPPEFAAMRARRYTPPQDAVEADVAAVWVEVLGLEQIGRDDNFFELGGHSLKAATLVGRVMERFGIELRLPALFDRPTVAGLAEAVRAAGGEAVDQKRHAVLQRRNYPDSRPVPLAPAQQRFWRLTQTIADKTVYNVPDSIRIHGPLQIETIKTAWSTVLQRQEVLRSVIIDGPDGACLSVRPHPAIFGVEDLTGLPADEREAAARRLIVADARTPFDLKNGPLCRARIIKLSDEEALLAWNTHHIIMDEGSRAAILNDLWAAYGGAIEGQPAALPSLPYRFADFCLDQLDRLPRIQEQQLAYWRTQLKDVAPAVVPPFFKPRPTTRTTQGGLYEFDIPAPLAESLRSLSRQAGVTPFVTGLTAFYSILFRYSGQNDLCIGTAVSNRPATGTEGIVGCFVNTVALRVSVEDSLGFRDMIARVWSVVSAGVANADVPFEKVVETVFPSWPPGGHPFFQSAFVYQNEELAGTAPGGLNWRLDHVEAVGAKFDFTMTLDDRPNGMRGQIEYSTDAYEASDAIRIAGHFLTLLEAACSQPETPVGKLPLLTEAEKQEVLVDWNKTAVDYPRACTATQLFETQATHTPEAQALSCTDRSLTFRAWNEQANRLAHLLQSYGVGPDVPVGVCLERTSDAPVAFLAAWKAGGAYVPLDPDFPPDRLEFYIADSKMPVLVTDSKLSAKLQVSGVRIIEVDRDAPKIAAFPATPPPSQQHPDQLAYVIYTSGSTGRPNGVQVPHRCLVNFSATLPAWFPMGPKDRVLAVTTFSFDVHAAELWGGSLNGAAITIATREQVHDGVKLARVMAQVKPTAIFATPGLYRLLLAAKWPGTPELRAGTGGESLPPDLAARMMERTRQVWNFYGPTETTIISSGYCVSRPDLPPPIGKPCPNLRYYVLDALRQPVPVGVPGELYIGGDGVTRGYHDRPELTGERFVNPPLMLSTETGRVYRTGDLVRSLPDGNIEFLGRIDHQVKIRGHRIELGEIERRLEQHWQVGEVVVVALKDPNGSEALHAYFELKENAEGELTTKAKSLAAIFPAAAELRKHLLAKLPDYMIPATFNPLWVLPRTPNGKVDRKALPAPSTEGPSQGGEVSAPPEGDAEKALVPVWEAVLGIKPISVTDEFQDLGGNSVSAAILMARIESQLGHRLPLEVLFEAPTVRRLAEVVQRKLEMGDEIVVPLQHGGSHPALFMIAGAGGHVFAFHKFARLMGSDIPAYGMKAVGVNGTEAPLDRFEDIAARYVREINAIYPTGPIILSGYSVGGGIALETALQLQAAGRSVPLIVAFDAFGPGYPERLPFTRRIRTHLGNILWSPWSKKKEYLRNRWSRVRERFLARAGLHKYNAPIIPGLGVVPQNALRGVWGALTKAHDAYWPSGPFQGKVLLVNSEYEPDWFGVVQDDPHRGWQKWAKGGVTIRSIPGTHLDLFVDENQPLLAGIVGETIRSLKE